MPRGRHSLVPTPVRRRHLALVTAPLVTALVVGAGVATSGAGLITSSSAQNNVGAAAWPSNTPSTTAPEASERSLGTSRSVDRVPLVDRRVPKVSGKLWTTSNLKLRIEPREKSRVAGLLKSDKRIEVTGREQGAYAEVITGRVTRWVTAAHLARKKARPRPKPKSASPADVGLSGQACPDGSSIESALQPASVRVYRAACAAFPELTTYGGQDGHGEHVNGQAIDFMVSSSSVGQRLADFLYANRAELDLFDIIWSQRIWTTERSSEGFRSMSDRGSSTANHYDHVHIMVN